MIATRYCVPGGRSVFDATLDLGGRPFGLLGSRYLRHAVAPSSGCAAHMKLAAWSDSAAASGLQGGLLPREPVPP